MIRMWPVAMGLVLAAACDGRLAFDTHYREPGTDGAGSGGVPGGAGGCGGAGEEGGESSDASPCVDGTQDCIPCHSDLECPHHWQCDPVLRVCARCADDDDDDDEQGHTCEAERRRCE